MAKKRAKKKKSAKRAAKKKKNPARRVPVLVANPVKPTKKKKAKKRKAMAKKKKKGKRGKARNPSTGGKKKNKKRRKKRRNPGFDFKKAAFTFLKVTGAVVGGLVANMAINEAGASLSQGWKDGIRVAGVLAAVGGGIALDQPVIGAALGAVVGYPVARDRVSSLLPQLAMGDLGKVDLSAVSVRRLPDGRMVARLPNGRTMGMVDLPN